MSVKLIHTWVTTVSFTHSYVTGIAFHSLVKYIFTTHCPFLPLSQLVYLTLTLPLTLILNLNSNPEPSFFKIILFF